MREQNFIGVVNGAGEGSDNGNNGGTNHEKTTKTYVWVRPFLLPETIDSDGHHKTVQRGYSNVTNKKRGAPTGNSKDVWGWTPGYYYCSSSVTSAVSSSEENNEKSAAESSSESAGKSQAFHHYTLLPLDANESSTGEDGDDHIQINGKKEYVIPESQTAQLLERGDILLANDWEEYDFVNRLELGGDDDDASEEYDYDDDESDNSDNDDRGGGRRRSTLTPQILDAPTTNPPHNLIELTHLHEPSVVHALRHRYECASTTGDMNLIYTDTGPILLAVNPFQRDESGLLYGDGTVEKYRKEGEVRWKKGRRELEGGTSTANARKDEVGGEGEEGEGSEDNLPPHVYAVADRTFRTMLTRLHPVRDGAASSSPKPAFTPQSPLGDKVKSNSGGAKINQSVLVSGESGAGKTVTTKLLMGYLAKLSARPTAGGDKREGDIKDKDGNGSIKDTSNMSIERRVLESNPIMESFGNARTVRNDNSSRFGKYIEMKFSSSGSGTGSKTEKKAKKSSLLSGGELPGATLVGASIETYLLEKVRLVHQSQGERNYHIFYELFSMKYEDDEESEEEDESEEEGDNVDNNVDGSGTAEPQKLEANSILVEKYGLVDYDMEDFLLINTSSTYDRRDGVTDSSTFSDLKRAMTVMGFTPQQQTNIFGVTSALLHASNLTFHNVGEVECSLEMDNPHLDYVVELLGIGKEGLNRALCYYEIVIGRGGGKQAKQEKHVRVLSREQAEKGVEALIKATYGAMFTYLVGRINESVAGEGVGSGKFKAKKSGKGAENEASIGILDIFGFESFQVNSFEQLCINYCNEALQQQFNRFVLRNEQEEYDREGIPWSFIEFPENQDVLDLIDFKGSGILNVLHDQCRTPGASDRTFALQMYEKCTSHPRFEADSRQVAEQLFAIHHYAGLVEYTIEGFVEKTRDELPKEATDLLLSSNNEFVQTLAKILQPDKSSSAPSKSASQRPTVGIQFSSQLHSLRRKIDDTSPHYIRCLKPNNLLVPNMFDAALIADQLRCAGVIEAVRVSRLGYPQRYSHVQFINRYRMLGMRALRKRKKDVKKFNPAKALVHAITEQRKKMIGEKASEEVQNVGIQVGKTKVFLNRQAYDLLEKMRRDKITKSAIVIQKQGRRYVYRKRYGLALRSVLKIQSFFRQVAAKKQVMELRRQHNSIIIQTAFRRYSARKRYLSCQIIARCCQTHHRGAIGRSHYNTLNRERKALYLQTRWRSYVRRRSFLCQRQAALVLQCSMRCYIARVELSDLKSEARNMQAIVQERDRLRQEAIQLKKELQQLKSEPRVDSEEMTTALKNAHTSISDKDSEIKTLWEKLEEALREKEAMECQLKGAKQTISGLESEKSVLAGTNDDLKSANENLKKEMTSQEEKFNNLEVRLSDEADARVEDAIAEFRTTKNENDRLTKEIEQIKKDNVKIQRENNELKKEVSKLEQSKEHVAESHAFGGADDDENDKLISALEELKRLKHANSILQQKNDSLQLDKEALEKEKQSLLEDRQVLDKDNSFLNNENTALQMSNQSSSLEHAKIEHRDSPRNLEAITENVSADHEQRQAVKVDDRSPVPITSVCTSLTVDMTETEEDNAKLRDENTRLRNELTVLRANFEELSKNLDNSDQEYDKESVIPDEEEDDDDENDNGSTDGETGHDESESRTGYSGSTEYIGDAVSDRVMKRICSEVEEATQEIILKFQNEINELQAEMEQEKRIAKYDMDDMNRVNRSLRADLEEATDEREMIYKELEQKCEELEELNADVEKFAETFALQHEELQQLEGQIKKLQAENSELKKEVDGKSKKITELEVNMDYLKASPKQNPEWVGSEIGKLWEEIAKMREPSESKSSSKVRSKSAPRRRQRYSSRYSSSDSSSEEEDDQFPQSVENSPADGLFSPLSMFSKSSAASSRSAREAPKRDSLELYRRAKSNRSMR